MELRRISRLAMAALGVSSATLLLVVLLFLFPRQAERITETSLKTQDWLFPYLGGAVAIVFSIAVVTCAAAFVVSCVSKTALPEVSKKE